MAISFSSSSKRLIAWRWIAATSALLGSLTVLPSSKPVRGNLREQSVETRTGPDYGTPKSTYRAFLRAVKANDLGTAKQCWFISDGNASGVLDILIGEWIAHRRLVALFQSKFTAKEREGLGSDNLEGSDYSDEAIDRALGKVESADIQTRGDTARMRVLLDKWPTRSSPGLMPCEARFRRVGGDWKLDANWEIGFQKPADFFQPASWYTHDPGQLALTNVLIADLESGKLRTPQEVLEAKQAGSKDLYAKGEAERKRKPLDPVDARFFAAWKIRLRYQLEYYAGRASMYGVYLWSSRLMRAECERSGKLEERVAAGVAHRERMRDLQFVSRCRVAAGRTYLSSYWCGDNYLAAAKLALAEAKAATGHKVPDVEARTTLRASARAIYEDLWEQFQKRDRRWSLTTLAMWGDRYLESLADRQTKPSDLQSELEDRLRRMKEMEEAFKGWLNEKTVTVQDASLATYFRADAEVRLDELKASAPVKKPLGESPRVRLDAAKAAYRGFLAEFLAGRCEPERLYTVSSFWRDAALALAATKAERIGAVTEHLARMKEVYPRVKAWNDAGRISTYELWAAEYYVAEAEIHLRRAREE
jgi:hypothetical protein